jgi:heme exporter protein B
MTPKQTAPQSWVKNVRTLLAHSLRVDISSKERVITPIFFALIILMLFSFAIPEPDAALRSRMMVAESQLAIFFALQIAFSRTFESERVDRIFDHLRLSPISSSAFITSKILHVLVIGGGTMLCTGVLSIILQGQTIGQMADPVVIGTALLTLLGLTGIGVLLASITLNAEGHQILFPLLYFPLSVPVLLCSTEGLIHWLDSYKWDSTMRGWSVMLIAFDVIYLTLTILLGTETVD